MDATTLARVEEQRLTLESNISKLRTSLRHWQTIEIDYEGLKEAFLGLPETASREECMQAAKDFQPELVDDKDLESLIGNSKRPAQLLEQLSKRGDYVLRNIETIRGQLSLAQRQWNALILAEDPDHYEEAGLPLREITEELDDDGNIVSSTVKAPTGDTSTLAEVLRKAGVTDLPKDGIRGENTTDDMTDDQMKYAAQPVVETDFNDDVSGPSTAELTPKVDNLMHPLNPDDTEQEANLRQEMLQYGLGEVGAIVAELDLEDVESGMSYDEYEDENSSGSDEDEDEDLYTDESEDERGALKHPMISDRYKRRMEALERKHGITDIQNLGPEPSLPEDIKDQIAKPPAAEAARKAAIARDDAVKNSKNSLKDNQDSKRKRSNKKKVAFAEELVIAPQHDQRTSTFSGVDPIGDNVVERSNTLKSGSTLQPVAPMRTNKSTLGQADFSRDSEVPHAPSFHRATPTGPKGQIISQTLVEHPVSQQASAPDLDDFDEELHQREIASEFQKLRNRKIHQQGGYVGGGEQDNYGDDIGPMVVQDKATGKPRKISRFKAARLKS